MPDPITPEPVPAPTPAPEPAPATAPADPDWLPDRLQRAKRSAVSEMLADLGAASLEEVKAALAERTQLKQAQMSDADKARADAEAAIQRAEAAEQKLAAKETEALRAKAIAEVNLPAEMQQFITGTTEDDIRAQVKTLAESIPAQSAGVPVPAGTAAPEVPADVALKAQYDDAMKRGDTLAALTLKSQMEAAKQ
jgi:hypothetical protein